MSDFPYPKDNSAQAWKTHYAEIRGEQMPALCPVCGGNEYVIDGALYRETGQMKVIGCPVCGKEKRRAWLDRNCGLEPIERLTMLSDWKLPAMADQKRSNAQRREAGIAIREAIHKRTGLFTFWGDFGAGKTHALHIVCNELRATGIETFYSSLESILGYLRSLYAAGRTSQHRNDPDKFWRRLCDIPVLAVDEVTRFNETSWAQAQLFELADIRYRRKSTHLTLFATNDDPRSPLPTNESLGYLFSRMREMSVVHLQGDVRMALR